MKAMRWLLLFVVVLLIFYVGLWFAGASMVNRQVDSLLNRLDARGIEVSTESRGLKGLLGFAAEYALDETTIAMPRYGASVETPGQIRAGVKLWNPFWARARVPAGSTVRSPLFNGELGEATLAAQLTSNAEVAGLSVHADHFAFSAISVVQSALNDMSLEYWSDQGLLSTRASMEGIEIPAFVKTMVERQLPAGVVLPEEDVDIVLEAELLPTGPLLDRNLTTLEPWLRNGGHVVITQMQIPFFEGTSTPKRGVVAMSAGGAINAILCEQSCQGNACEPSFVVRGGLPDDAQSVSQMILPGAFAGMTGPQICAATDR